MKLIAALLIVSLPAHVTAQMKHVPAWSMNGPMACYDFQDAKKLVEIDSQLEMFIQRDMAWGLQVQDLKSAVLGLTSALDNEKAAKNELSIDVDALNKQLIAEVTRANNAEAKKMPSLGWLFAGVGALVVVGAVVGILLYAQIRH